MFLQIRTYRFFDKFGPSDAPIGTITISQPDDPRGPEDHFGCTTTRTCGTPPQDNGNGGFVGRSPTSGDSKNSNANGSGGNTNTAGDDNAAGAAGGTQNGGGGDGGGDDACDGTGEACDNAEIESNSDVKSCMAACEPPTAPEGPFDCDGMRCFIKCSAKLRCTCRHFASGKCW